MLQNLVDIFVAPKAVFARLLHKPTVLLPLLLVVLSVASIQVGYITTTDKGFLVDQFIEQALARRPDADEAQLRGVYENLSPTTLIASAAISSAIFITVILLVNALYLSFISKFGHESHRYKHWLSLVCWTGLPVVLTALAAWVTMLTGNGQVSLTALQPLSMDSLLGLNSGKQILQNLSLPQFWAMGLLVLGYRHFTGASLAKSAVVTLAPYVIIYGVWAYFAFR
ncbi:MAG: YIP1 family protein [Gammaproteobacteria bacterium]|nr:YIP1 family protein [Gammaproteobacteria bacterium]